MSINGHKTSCTRTMYLKKKEKKRYIASYIASSLHPSIITTPPLIKMSNSPPKNDYFISKTTSPFCHEWQRVRVSSRHLISKANISIIIIQSIIIITNIIILILRIRSHGRRRWRGSLISKSAHGRLPSSYATNMDVQLIQLYGECI